MTRNALRLSTAAILAAGLLTAPTAATAVDRTGDTAGPEAALMIDGFHPEGLFRLSVKPRGGPGTIVTLRCPSGRGSHPDPEAACAALAGADGRIEDIPARSGACTKQYAPVSVSAIGVWHGKPRLYKERFGNECEAVGRTGGDVFDF